MKVKAYRTHEVEVELDLSTIFKALQDYIYSLAKVQPGSSIVDGKWQHTVHANTSHSFEYEEIIRDASISEQELWYSLLKLKANLKEFN
jgi:hypothetical protein